MLENLSNICKSMNRLKIPIFLLTTNLSWLMKQKNALTVSTVSRFLKFDFYASPIWGLGMRVCTA